MSFDRRKNDYRRHNDKCKCQQCSKPNCSMNHCSEEYRMFYEKQKELDFELMLIFNSVREILNIHKK